MDETTLYTPVKPRQPPSPSTIVFLVVLLLLVILWRYWRYLYPFLDYVFTRLIRATRLRVILVKRCDQSSTYEIENHIKSRLKSRVRFLEKPWDRGLDNGERPVIVFCVISSRIGTDIESAMRGVHGNSRVILVLLHCIISSFLRSDLSDDEELLDATMKNRMTGIAHFAFSEREGVYDCKQNRDGLQKLVNLINFLN
ncbi:uncharacterized protein LOC116292472 [Actinia tenebrosa]|uniref:Uncharacterized protein LOC116292472 n=1 Tax=Actinia tenebrosa TaxID=6105 RepID=A0A6P8HSK1_ACTTE|nr:uncharacterized protein LOC116292472 [Actinia tenebrosa]